jgi:hypothetical protein
MGIDSAPKPRRSPETATTSDLEKIEAVRDGLREKMRDQGLVSPGDELRATIDKVTSTE